MPEFLLEILSEEIPARMQAKAASDLAKMVGEGIAASGLAADVLRTYVTPRRLVLVAEGVPAASADIAEERRGPRIDAPQPAIDGFLKSTGLSLDQLEQRDTGKGVFYFAILSKKGRQAVEVLKETVEKTMADFPWPKSMRWGANAVRWVRPVQSILALFDGAVVPISFGPVNAGAVSRGHRFLAPADFSVRDFADYEVKIRDAKVLIDPVERRHAIFSQAEQLAGSKGLTVKQDDGLLDEVTGLVEWPAALMGQIDDQFMSVPAEVLMTSMRTHQKYFSLLQPSGALAPYFIAVSNMQAADGGAAILSGNQRVLRARLSDAAFFWDHDRKTKLADRVQSLEQRVFFQGLGTVLDKAKRLETLAGYLASFTGADCKRAERAGLLAKADLSTDMVGEFPELQGLMGRYYALNDGEPAELAQAIADHYSPAGPGDSCPTGPVSVAVALADRIDTLVGFFAINEKPTGSKDPFALRRAALGVIRLIVENQVRLGLGLVFKRAEELILETRKLPSRSEKDTFLSQGYGYVMDVKSGLPAHLADLLDFFADRLKVHLKDQGVRHDLVAAVFSLGGEDDLVRLLARVEALSAFVNSEDGVNLLAAYRRAVNIVRIEEKKDGAAIDGELEEARLVEPEEQTLSNTLRGVRTDVGIALEAEDFIAAMAALSRLRQPVDAFFDKVTVNADEPALRTNRLRLLSEIGRVMELVANFAVIEG